MGMAALIPVGTVLDRGDGQGRPRGGRGCGLREIKIRRMLDPQSWGTVASTQPKGQSVIVDPLGCYDDVYTFGGGTANGGSQPFTTSGTAAATVANVTPFSRITLVYPGTTTPLPHWLVDSIFTWQDDLIFTKPEDMHPQPTTANGSTRPLTLDAARCRCPSAYSWFFMATPSPMELSGGTAIQPNELHYTVSVVVCYRRDYSKDSSGNFNGEKTAEVNLVGGGLGGGDVLLSNCSKPFSVKENEWIALIGPLTGGSGAFVCRWYRVVAVGDDNLSLSLNGPDATDWAQAGVTPMAVSIDKAIVGVYTTTIEVDRDVTW